METQELLMTVVRSVGVFVLLLVVVRLLGKRTVGNFSAFDLIVALMLGEVVDEIIYADVTFLQGAVTICVVAAAKYVTSVLSYWGHGLDTLLEGKPTVLVRDGEFQRDGLRSELMNEREVMAAMRLQGIDDLREVKLAAVEVDGLVSVVQMPWAEPLQKCDLPGPARDEKERTTGGQDDPPPDKRTDDERYVA
jgi:uncharacterized membrane protein YcaP (DUF421 family)